MPRAKSKTKNRNSKIDSSLSPSDGERAGVRGSRHSKIHWERLLLIHQRIKSGSCPSASALAAELETSRRTILRDIQFIKDRLRLPVQYDPLRYGFFYNGPADDLPLPPLSEADLFSLLIAHKAIAQYLGTPLEKPLRLAFDKLTRQLDTQHRYGFQNLDAALSFRPFAPEDTDLAAFQTITKAIANSKAIKFLYRNRAPLESSSVGRTSSRAASSSSPSSSSLRSPGSFPDSAPESSSSSFSSSSSLPGSASPSAEPARLARPVKVAGPARPRLVHPYHLACINNLWYLFAWDPSKHDLRTFALHRLTRPQLTTQKFTKPKNFDPDALLRGSLNVFKGREDHDILIQFDPWAADEIRDRRWHSSQQITNLPDGGCQLRLHLSSLEEIEGWILSFGNHAKVVQPSVLSERIAKVAKSVASKYSDM
jgi:proteasome accessory factor B